MTTVTDVIENALALSLTDRSYIASKLIESLEADELSPEAIQNYDHRVAGWKSGQARPSSSADLDAKVHEILNR
jgi:hypothetical protein